MAGAYRSRSHEVAQTCAVAGFAAEAESRVTSLLPWKTASAGAVFLISTFLTANDPGRAGEGRALIPRWRRLGSAWVGPCSVRHSVEGSRLSARPFDVGGWSGVFSRRSGSDTTSPNRKNGSEDQRASRR